MALEDSNHDGVLNASDAHWAQLQVWVDANHDGVTNTGELRSLDSLGIASLDLGAQKGSTVDNGNLLGLSSSYTTTDGQTHDMADVWFAKQHQPEAESSAPSLGELLVAPSQVLPTALTEHAAAAATQATQVAAVIRQDNDDLHRHTPLL